jgi:hypothetical protein
MGEGRPPVVRSRRFFFFGEDRHRAFGASGAITTSVKISTIRAAVSASSVWFSATMPPKAEVRSQSKARE